MPRPDILSVPSGTPIPEHITKLREQYSYMQRQIRPLFWHRFSYKTRSIALEVALALHDMNYEVHIDDKDVYAKLP